MSKKSCCKEHLSPHHSEAEPGDEVTLNGDTYILLEREPSSISEPLPYLKHECPQCGKHIYWVKYRWRVRLKGTDFTTHRKVPFYHDYGRLKDYEINE